MFDLWRCAILLVAGDKVGNWTRWYHDAIPRAEQLYRRYLIERQMADMRKRRGLTQLQVADRMAVSVGRVSQIESGDVSTRDVLERYVAALGGTLKLVADFGDEQLKVG